MKTLIGQHTFKEDKYPGFTPCLESSNTYIHTKTGYPISKETLDDFGAHLVDRHFTKWVPEKAKYNNYFKALELQSLNMLRRAFGDFSHGTNDTDNEC